MAPRKRPYRPGASIPSQPRGEPLSLPYATRMDYAMEQLATIGNARAGQLWIFLCQKADQKTGACHWSKEKLAAQLGVSVRTIFNATERLESSGYLRVDRDRRRDGRWGSNRYTVLRAIGKEPAAADGLRQEAAQPSATPDIDHRQVLAATIGKSLPRNRPKEPTQGTDPFQNRRTAPAEKGQRPSRRSSRSSAASGPALTKRPAANADSGAIGKKLPMNRPKRSVRKRPGLRLTVAAARNMSSDQLVSTYGRTILEAHGFTFFDRTSKIHSSPLWWRGRW